MSQNQNTLAVFIDYENLAMGMPRDKHHKSRHIKEQVFPDMQRVLSRLVDKGRIAALRAYCDWQRFEGAVTSLHELGIELIEIPVRASTGKNSADIRLSVDAMEMSFTKTHIDTFVICSGDSDFSPLVAKLKEFGKQVIGVGMRPSTSALLEGVCDEFLFYEDIVDGLEVQSIPDYKKKVSKEKWPIYQLMFETVEALLREDYDPIFASHLKSAMKRKKPGFSETTYGYRNFSHVLQDASSQGLLQIRKDKNSGTFVVEGFVEQ